MTTVDTGSGSPIVVVPGVHGRWEHVKPAVDALALRHRVITFSLTGGATLDGLVAQVESALDERGLAHAAICGISFGGRVALRFAARRPERTTALVLVSVPGPRFRLRHTHRAMAHRPLLYAPLFFAAVPGRLWAEVRTAMPDPKARRTFVRRQLRAMLRAPVSPSQMAARALQIDGTDTAAECAAVRAPTLVISGEPSLDYVVPTNGTSEYGKLIAGARSITLAGTGHLGSITRPEAFADAVTGFLRTVS